MHNGLYGVRHHADVARQIVTARLLAQELDVKHFAAICLIAVGLAAMFGGIAANAKCRNEGMRCCLSFGGIGLLCR
jgi:CHASE2 domain-containing sensor protein